MWWSVTKSLSGYRGRVLSRQASVTPILETSLSTKFHIIPFLDRQPKDTYGWNQRTWGLCRAQIGQNRISLIWNWQSENKEIQETAIPMCFLVNHSASLGIHLPIWRKRASISSINLCIENREYSKVNEMQSCSDYKNLNFIVLVLHICIFNVKFLRKDTILFISIAINFNNAVGGKYACFLNAE